MWNDLPDEDKQEYKKMILAFASLTEMFAQKKDEEKDVIPAPIINTKYQETVFQKVFKAFAEDIGNTSFDASLIHPVTKAKYLIGIKTFGISSGVEKIAQFKAMSGEWVGYLNEIRSNSINPDGSAKTRVEINAANSGLYLQLAREIARIRNMRIGSSISSIRGFQILEGDEYESVYHILMPSPKGESPVIYVGETSYDFIDINEIQILGCTTPRTPTYFEFTDGLHRYKFTSGDYQLYMDFDSKNIVLEHWNVKFAEDAYAIFEDIARKVYSEPKPSQSISESYCWKIEIEPYSGFNSFYGVGPKPGLSRRDYLLNRLCKEYSDTVEAETLKRITDKLRLFLLGDGSEMSKKDKENLRDEIRHDLESQACDDFKEEVLNLIYRPIDEMYIPIPDSKNFHKDHPDFFVKGLGNLKLKPIANVPIEARKFMLVFEPSGQRIESKITQENGKGIESVGSMAELGGWIRRKIFQLEEYEPLTEERLNEIGINGLRLYKLKDSPEVHIQFIWIDDENPPSDIIRRKRAHRTFFHWVWLT